jgi:cytochrome oxidase Cu insertion factor (SCO1/SenC/PrrC family)
MGTSTLIGLAALALLAADAGLARAQAPDPLAAMAALRPTGPTPAPDVVFRTLDGRSARLAELRGRPVLLTFFTTW